MDEPIKPIKSYEKRTCEKHTEKHAESCNVCIFKSLQLLLHFFAHLSYGVKRLSHVFCMCQTFSVCFSHVLLFS